MYPKRTPFQTIQYHCNDIQFSFIIFTTRIRRMRVGNIFSLFTPGGRGYPLPVQMGGTPSPTQSQQVRGWGTPIHSWQGGPSCPDMGVLLSSSNGTGTHSQSWQGLYGGQVRIAWRYPPPPVRQSEYLLRDGGMPLVFTQEDFLGQQFVKYYFDKKY